MSDHVPLFIISLCIPCVALLLWMLFPMQPEQSSKKAEKAQRRIKGYCPLCNSALYPGEKLRSDQTEILGVEVQTRIKGCVHCIAAGATLHRRCPICRKALQKTEHIFALSHPRIDKHKLKIKGCASCFPEAFLQA